MPLDREQRRWLIATYLMTRKSRWLLAMMIVIGVVVGGWGALGASVPAATSSGVAEVPLWRLLAVGSASLPVLTLASPLQALETTATSSYYLLRRLVLCIAFAISSICILVGAVVGIGPGAAPVLARALLVWFGLALVSGRVLSWTYSWVLPCVIMCVLHYWGHDPSGHGYRWWEFTVHPAGHLPSMILAFACLVAGLAAYALSPWRINTLARAGRVAPDESSTDLSRARAPVNDG